MTQRGESAASASGSDDDWETAADTGRLEEKLWNQLKASAAASQPQVAQESKNRGRGTTAAPSSRRDDYGAASEVLAGDMAAMRIDAGKSAPKEDTIGSFPDGARHVAELHGFTPDTTGEDLDLVIGEVSGGTRVPPYLAWVDDTHCLAVFANALDASRAVGAHKRLLRERGVQLGDPALRLAAESTHAATLAMPLSRLMPARPRPQGTAAVARRMIGGALGIDMDKQLASLSQARGEQGERARRMVEEGEKLRGLQKEAAKTRERERAAREAQSAETWE